MAPSAARAYGSTAAPAPVASWIHVEGGAIRRVQVAFEPRGMLAAAPS